MSDLADIFAPDTDEQMIERLLARDIDALAPHELALLEAALRRNVAHRRQLIDFVKFVRASRVLLDLLDEEAKRGSRSARRARKLNPNLVVLAKETWAAAGRVLPAIQTLSEDEPERSWAAVAAVFRALGPRCPPDQLPRLTVELYEAAEAVRHLQARAKGQATQTRRAKDRAAARAALVQAVRRIAGELPPSPYRKTKSARALHVLGRLNREAARGDAGHPAYHGNVRSFVKFCGQNSIEI